MYFHIGPQNIEDWKRIIIAETMCEKKDEKLRILYAEDNIINQKIIKAFAQKLGYLCDIAENGKQAVDMHSRNNYDCILMDIQMPVMDGMEATRVIRNRELSGCDRVPIIAVTASSPYDDQQEFRKMGMDYYVPKPVSFETIKAVIDTFLNVE